MKQSPLICCDRDEEYLDRNVYPYLQSVVAVLTMCRTLHLEIPS
jgi:hypothetical protein